jgi:HK97 family phage major capsid protein
VSSIAQLNKSASLDSAGFDLIRATKLLAAARGDLVVARQAAAQIGNPRLVELMENSRVGTKGAINVGVMTDAISWYAQLAEGFFGSMSEFSALSKIYTAGDFFNVPLRTLVAVLTTAPVGAAVSELAAKPFSSGSFATQKFEPHKVTAMIAVSNELARSISPAATLQFSRELRRAASIAADSKMLSILAATPGMSTAASTGVTASAVLADLTARLTSLTIGADSRLWWVVSPKLFKELSLLPMGSGGYLMNGNRIGGISVAPSDAAASTAFLFDARQIAAELETAVISVSGEASVEMADNPTATDYQLFSAFQNNATISRAEIWFGCLALRSTAITTLTGYS